MELRLAFQLDRAEIANIGQRSRRPLLSKRSEHLVHFWRAEKLREGDKGDRAERDDRPHPSDSERQAPGHPVRQEPLRDRPYDRSHPEARENQPKQPDSDPAHRQPTEPLPEEGEKREEVDPEARRRRSEEPRVAHRPGESDTEPPE